MTAANRGIIFDLDGTLADTPQAITTIMLKVLAGSGVVVSETDVRPLVGLPLEQNFARLLDRTPDDPTVTTAAGDYHRLFREYVLGNTAALHYPGAAEGLSRLYEDGYLLGVATSKPRGAAQKMLQLMEIDELFGAVAGDDTVPRGKPAPDMARHVAEKLGLRPDECVVVGDGTADVAMGVAAGMRVIGVSYGVATAAQLTEAGADHVVDSFDDLVSLLLAGRLTDNAREA